MLMPSRRSPTFRSLRAMLGFALELPTNWLKCVFCQAVAGLRTLGKCIACIQMLGAGQQMCCRRWFRCMVALGCFSSCCILRCFIMFHLLMSRLCFSTHSMECQSSGQPVRFLRQRIHRSYVYGLRAKLFCPRKTLWTMPRCNDVFKCEKRCGRDHNGSCGYWRGHLALDTLFYSSRSTERPKCLQCFQCFEGAVESAGTNPSAAVWLGEDTWQRSVFTMTSPFSNRGIPHKTILI